MASDGFISLYSSVSHDSIAARKVRPSSDWLSLQSTILHKVRVSFRYALNINQVQLQYTLHNAMVSMDNHQHVKIWADTP